MDFLKLAEQRYSVRKFSDRPLEPEKIERILEAGRLAPTACNKQPQRVLVINGEQSAAKMRMCTGSHFNAPAGLLVCYDRDECWVRDYDGKPSGDIDASIVATHMMLEAAELGIGTTWVMHFIPEAVRCEFALPENIEPVALLVMGYPADDAVPSPMHAKSRTNEELVVYDRF